PATSANLGPGFDSLGLALSLHDDVDAWIRPSGLSVEVLGEGAGLVGAGEEHLVVRAMRAAFGITGGQPPGIGLRCVNRIPHGRGLGSSAAAIVAGILAARALAARGPGKLPDDAVFRLATGLEGHPDNVAACLGGGLTVAWMAVGGPRMVRLDPAPWITPVVCVAPSPVRTDVARGRLPDVVPHRDAAANAGRSALLVAALTQHRTAPHEAMSLLLDATEDWLHQGYRVGAMPETDALVRSLRAAGLPAVVSGAGPSVLVLLDAREGLDRHHLDSLGSIVKETGIAWHISSLDVERQGARVLRPEPPSGC
ncbi:MAG TPA: homoserine kinase, partial [Streptosporangiaceae bacterium]|nr:homoserine kinase [Streptosporangiaceae bacterium]